MSKCDYFRIDTKIITNNELRSDRGRTEDIIYELPWCNHPKHSPVSKNYAKKTINGGNALKCTGELAKCPIDIDKF